MQPQTPASPDPSFDFILNDQQKQRSGRKFSLSGLPKPVIFSLVAVVLLLVVTAIGLVARGGGSNTDLLTTAAGQAREISRVSALVETQTKDPDTQSLAATTKTVLASHQSQLTGHLSRVGVKVDPKEFILQQNKNTDQQLQQAAVENKLEQTYHSYLKSSLAEYLNNLQKAYPSLSDKGKVLVTDAFNSGRTLLSAPQLLSIPSS